MTDVGDGRMDGDRRRAGVLRYGWSYLRHNGLVPTLSAFARRYVYRSLEHVIMCSRTIDQDAADHVGDVVLRLATPADAERLRRFDQAREAPHRPPLGVHREWCFIACDGDRIVASRRYMDELPSYRLVSRVVRLQPGQLWADDVYCLAEYRGRGIARSLGLFAQRVLATDGYRDFFGSISVTNAASLRMTLHDSDFVCHLRYVRLLLYERLRVSTEIPPPLREAVRDRPRSGG